jgi:hypothetical protein
LKNAGKKTKENETEKERNVECFRPMSVIEQVKSLIPERATQWLSNPSLVSGLLLGAALSPVLAPIVLCLLPVLTLSVFVLGALSAYAMLGPMQAKLRDFRYFFKAGPLFNVLAMC